MSKVNPSEVSIIQGDTKTKLTTYINGEEASGFERAIAPGTLLVLFYLVIVLLANQMLTSTTEEKENRVIEMILTTVDATTLIVGKIISLIMVGILQILVIILPIVIAFTFFKDQLNLPAIDFSRITLDPTQMTIGVLLFICAFMLFTGILVAIGAAVPTAKEANSFFGAAIGGMFIPLYAFMAVVSSPEQLIVKVFSFFPITAPVTLLLRNAAGNLPLNQAIIGIIILAVSSIIALAVATRAFRYGTLEYHRKLSFKELFGRA
jgi:ABC-2 type transport system permease protein